MVSIGETEEHVVRLHKDGKTTREISKVVRKNFTYIGAVLRRRFPDEYVNNDNSKTISKETQALKLFKKGRDLVYVVTKLDMKTQDVREIYSEFLNLQGLYSLTDIHSELGNTLPSFVQAYKKIIQSRIGIDKVMRIAEILDEILKIENHYNELRENVEQLCQLKFGLTGDVNRLRNQIIQLQNYFNSLQYQYKTMR